MEEVDIWVLSYQRIKQTCCPATGSLSCRTHQHLRRSEVMARSQPLYGYDLAITVATGLVPTTWEETTYFNFLYLITNNSVPLEHTYVTVQVYIQTQILEAQFVLIFQKSFKITVIRVAYKNKKSKMYENIILSYITYIVYKPRRVPRLKCTFIKASKP